MAGCKGVTDAAITQLAARGALARITAADVTGCEGLSAGGLKELAASAPRLHTLRCGGRACRILLAAS